MAAATADQSGTTCCILPRSLCKLNIHHMNARAGGLSGASSAGCSPCMP